MTRIDDGRLRIDRADPQILISGELIDRIIDEPTDEIAVESSGNFGTVGAILKINAVNQRLVYRITGYIPRIHAFTAEWPD